MPTPCSVALALSGSAVRDVSFDLDDQSEGSEIKVDPDHGLAGAAMHYLTCRARQPVLTTKHEKATFQTIAAARVDQN